MILRDYRVKPKNVMLVCDFPVANEIKSGEKFTSVSNMALSTSLKTGFVNNFDKRQVVHNGIPYGDVFETYLDYEGYSEGNFDYKLDIVKGKDRLEGTDYYKLDNQKDVWVSARLWGELQKLLDEIREVQPKLIVVAGKWALFLLTGCISLISNMGKYNDKKPLGCLDKFRASIMLPSECYELHTCIIVPIIHTVHVMAMPDKLSTMELDIQKLGWMYHKIKELGVEYYIRPETTFILGTTVEIIKEYLTNLIFLLDKEKLRVSIDLETMFQSTIDCIGIAYSADHGICIPFAHKGNANYWSIEDETYILCLIRSVMLHPNIIHIGQNYSYDCQYFWRLWGLHIVPGEDTMILHHILYNYLPKNLAFLASRYCEFYSYWKDDITAIAEAPETRWVYNIKDVCYTYEVLDVLSGIMDNHRDDKLKELYRFQMDKLSPAAIHTMNRGVKIDVKLKQELHTFFSKMLNDIVLSINEMLGFEFNINSPQQKKKVFKDFLGMTLKIKKGKGSETCEAAAMLDYIEEYTLYKPFLVLLLEHASLKVFTNNFLGMKLDDDNRARTQYRIAGTDTGRLASTKNVWGKGANLQNLPSKGKIDLRYATQLDSILNNVEVSESDFSEVDDLLTEMAYSAYEEDELE